MHCFLVMYSALKAVVPSLPQDLSTGKELMSPISGTSGDVVWGNDNNTLFYIVKDHLDRWVRLTADRSCSRHCHVI